MRLISILLLIFASPAFAGTITGVSDSTPSHGQSITISGSGFGSKSTAAPLLWDDFESGSVGASVATSGKVAWSTDGTAPVFSTDNNRTGASTKNAKAVLAGSGVDGNYHDCFSKSNLDLNGKAYVGFWAYFNSYAPGNQIKHWRINNGGGGVGYPSYLYSRTDGWGRYQYTYPSGSDCGTAGSGSWYDSVSDNIFGQWIFIELVADFGTVGGSDGSIHIFVNGVDQGGKDNYTLLTSASCPMNAVRFGEYIQDSTGTLTNYFDDIYVDNTWARVIIGNASSFSSCTQRELQRASAWADGSVSITVNRGGFSESASAYLYVVEDDGTVSNGYPITFGEGGEDTTPPTISDPSPSGTLECPADPSAVTISINTNESATCKYDTSDVAYDSMANTFSTTGRVSHSQSISSACSGSYTFYTRCSDSAGNKNASSTTISYTMGAESADTTDPVVTISAPTADEIYATTSSTVDISGTASDAGGIASVTCPGESVSGTESWSFTATPALSVYGTDLSSPYGDFDESADVSQWTANAATLSHQTTYGGRSGVIQVADNGTWSAAYRTFTVDQDGYYRVSAYAYAEDNPDTLNAILRIFQGAYADSWGDVYVLNDVADEWVQLIAYVRATGTSLTVALHSDEAYTAWFDDVKVEEVTPTIYTVTAEDNAANTGSDSIAVIRNDPVEAPTTSGGRATAVITTGGMRAVEGAGGMTIK